MEVRPLRLDARGAGQGRVARRGRLRATQGAPPRHDGARRVRCGGQPWGPAQQRAAWTPLLVGEGGRGQRHVVEHRLAEGGRHCQARRAHDHARDGSRSGRGRVQARAHPGRCGQRQDLGDPPVAHPHRRPRRGRAQVRADDHQGAGTGLPPALLGRRGAHGPPLPLVHRENLRRAEGVVWDYFV